MSFYINPKECVNCLLCETICPVDAIKELDCVRWIDPEICTNCNLCPEVCPSDCIFDEDKKPQPQWILKWHKSST